MHSHPRPAFDDAGRRIAHLCALQKIERFQGVHWDGVYLTMSGDRVGTEAEGILRAEFADFAGMCVSTEASMAMDLGLHYIPICFVVDNDADFNHTGGTEAVMGMLSEPDRVPAYLEDLLPRLQSYAKKVRPLAQLRGNIIFHNLEHIENMYLREIAEELREVYGR
jgi:purine nucleoside phosphorylase